MEWRGKFTEKLDLQRRTLTPGLASIPLLVATKGPLKEPLPPHLLQLQRLCEAMRRAISMQISDSDMSLGKTFSPSIRTQEMDHLRAESRVTP